MRARNTSMSSRSDSGSFEPPDWFCSRMNLLTCAASARRRLSRYLTCAFVRFSSLLTKTMAETQNSLVLCCLSRSRMIFRLADVSAGRVGKRVAANEEIDAGLVEFLASQKLV